MLNDLFKIMRLAIFIFSISYRVAANTNTLNEFIFFTSLGWFFFHSQPLAKDCRLFSLLAVGEDNHETT